MSEPIDSLLRELGAAIENRSSEEKRAWWERYMKGAIRFRGTGLPIVREELETWHERHGLDRASLDVQLEIVNRLFETPIGEEKLAAILYLQRHLIDKLEPDRLLDHIEGVLDRELVYDWSTCDWLCMRVLGPAIRLHGSPAATRIASWRDADYLWKARAALVPFVKVIERAEYRRLVLRTSKVLIRRNERFAKTAVGWVMRELSRHDREAVRSFIESNRPHFTRESLRNAMKYFADP